MVALLNALVVVPYSTSCVSVDMVLVIETIVIIVMANSSD